MTIPPWPSNARVPLRLRMSPRAGRGGLDGAWWPQSDDLGVELADLVDHFPASSGRVLRAVWSVREGAGLVVLTTSCRAALHLFVVPPDTAQAPAEAALLAAAAQGSAEGAEHLLAVAQKASGQVRPAYPLKRPARRLRAGLSATAASGTSVPVR